jgi:hypothetical protein
MERAVIFGSGSRGRDAYAPISKNAAVLGFVDNDPAQQHTRVLDRPVYPPATLADLDFDVVYVASSHVDSIRRQLIDGGIPASRIRLVPGLIDTAPMTTPRVENSLQDYLSKGYEEIAGWLHTPAVEATLLLAEIQRAHVAPGPVCEIGVWEGRYLSLLSFLPATPQRVLAIDPLIHGGNREQQLARLQRNIATYTRRPDLVTLLEKDSKQVPPSEILNLLGAPCQFVSVDGDHTMEGAMHDLAIAEAITAPGGIVALDDIPNFSCPGVTEGVMRHTLDDRHQLAPFLLVANKLFMTQKEYCETYRRELIAAADSGKAGKWGQQVLNHRSRMHGLSIPVRFLGQELLVAA